MEIVGQRGAGVTAAKHRIAVFLLLAFTVSRCGAQSQPSYSLTGTIVTPSQVLAGGAISIAGNKIADVRGSAGAGQAIDTDSFIFPGLIDLHNHITWNIFPRWRTGQLYRNRYEWQRTAAYSIALDGPHRAIAADHALACDAARFGEIKAIVGGATSIVGNLAPTPGAQDNACILGLTRDLDIDAGFDGSALNREKLRYEIFPFEMPLARAGAIRSGLESGAVTALLVHVGEGSPADAASAREFSMLAKGGDGFLRPGVSVIHGVAFNRSDLQQMARAGVGLIWSPRSNVELYGATADVRSAKQAGVRMAVSPDWSPTGSDGMIEELKYASTWNAAQEPPVFESRELVEMATRTPAQLGAAGDRIGTLAKGMYADLLLIRRNGTDAYQALTEASPADVRLVVIGGVPVYGDRELMERLLPGRPLEELTVCGAPKRLYIQAMPGIAETQKSFKQIAAELEKALAAQGTSLAELAPCSGGNLN